MQRSNKIIRIFGSFEVSFQIQHTDNIGTMQINVHETNLMAFGGKSQGQINRNSGFPDSTLSTHYQNLIFYLPERPGNGIILLRHFRLLRLLTSTGIA